MATALEIARGISQVMANVHDGALDENGDPISIGLKREEDISIHDRKIMDGFKVALYGDHLCLKYHGEVFLKEVHANGFEDDIANMLNVCLKFLKKEYKNITGEALSLKKVDEEPDIVVQSTSRVRSWVQAKQHFQINGMKGVETVTQESEDRLDDAIKSWLAIGKDQYPKSKKPENVSGKRDEEPRT